jgi:hypothetical protein
MGVKTALHSNQNPGGVFSIEDQAISTGNRYYVDSVTGSSAYSGDNPNTPKATLAQAVALCTADKDDIIYVMPKHVETTTALSIDKAGIRIIGLGYGRNKPALTATTAATDLLGVAAANVYVENIRLVGAASGCTALLNLGAADFYGKGLVFEHGAAPLMAVTVVAASHRFVLEDCQWRGTAAGPDCAIDIEGKVDDWKVIRPRADYGGSSGLDLAFLRSSFAMKGYEIIDPVIVGFDTVSIDINSSSAAVGDGVCFGGTSVASAGITVANANDAGGCVFINHLVGDAVGATGLRWPNATPT